MNMGFRECAPPQNTNNLQEASKATSVHDKALTVSQMGSLTETFGNDVAYHPCLIIGAGPAGGSLACFLAQNGAVLIPLPYGFSNRRQDLLAS